MTSLSPDVATVARMIDYTLLKPEATPADVTALIGEAIELGTYSVCVSPSMLPLPSPLAPTSRSPSSASSPLANTTKASRTGRSFP